MGFNSSRFVKQEFQQREGVVEVPALRSWFDLPETKKDEEPAKCLWKVRGLTAVELARTFEAASKVKNFSSLVEALGSSETKIEELKEVLGVGNDVPSDIMKRLEQLTIGSLEPIDLSVAQKLAEKFPIEFYQITNKITALTGLGMDLKK